MINKQTDNHAEHYSVDSAFIRFHTVLYY